MAAEDTYKSVGCATEGLYKDKGSRFLAYVYPISSEDEVKPLVDALRKEHHAARHHCFSYRIGCDGATMRANDDGEPSGTAGRPILGVIDKYGLSDVMVVVVRYFGGILLGVPGLIRAYREAAEDALSRAEIVQKVRTRRFELEFDYLAMNDLQKIVKAFPGLDIVGQEFDLRCRMTVEIPFSQGNDLTVLIEKNNNEKGSCIQCRPL